MPSLNWEGRREAVRAADGAPFLSLQRQESFGTPCGNLLIQGDNLDALKSLLPHYAGSVKCVFIDPPYNTGKAFGQYDDNLQHSQWLSLMYPRLVLLRELLADNGSIWIIIDDDEAHYLKVIADEIFGRKNFVANVVWQKKYAPQNDARWLSDNHDHVLVYAKNKDVWRPFLLPRTDAMNARYKNPDNDPRGDWKPSGLDVKTYAKAYDYPITTPSGRVVNPPKGRCWRTSYEGFLKLVNDNRICFGKTGNNVPAVKRFLSEVKDGSTAMTIWLYCEAGHNQDAKKEVEVFNGDDVFATPKPEKLIQRILNLSTKPGDLVLDSFLGSGTTAAVAHKMGRRYIGIEMGEHAKTHCIPRLQKVIDGETGGISKAENWTGGGGFCFMTLGAPIFDDTGAILPNIKFAELAAHVWFYATKTPLPPQTDKTPFLGVCDDVGYVLLYNDILKDKHPLGDNILTNDTLRIIRTAAPKDFCGKLVIYGSGCRLSPRRMTFEKTEFRQIPYDCKQEES